MVGLDNAGKTTTLYQLHCGEALETVPTVVKWIDFTCFVNLWPKLGQQRGASCAKKYSLSNMGPR
jgi:hypothetical protein